MKDEKTRMELDNYEWDGPDVNPGKIYRWSSESTFVDQGLDGSGGVARASDSRGSREDLTAGFDSI